MEIKERTIGEICDNPESITEKEKESIGKLFKALKELGKACEPYSNIKPILKNTANTLSERFYQEHFIMSAVLEAFFLRTKFLFKSLIKLLLTMSLKNLFGISLWRV